MLMQLDISPKLFCSAQQENNVTVTEVFLPLSQKIKQWETLQMYSISCPDISFPFSLRLVWNGILVWDLSFFP